MSLLTADDGVPSTAVLKEFTIKHLRKGDKFFSPVTLFDSVVKSDGTTLEECIKLLDTSIKNNTGAINNILKVSNSNSISSLGDVRLFLSGFNNGDNLKIKLDTIEQEMLRFEKTGQIHI